MTTDGFDDDISEEVTEPEEEGSGVTIDDFIAYMPAGTFIFTPCREPWVAASINARLPRVLVLDKNGQPKRDAKGKLVTMSPTKWLANNRAVEQMTWAPGFPMVIPDRLVVRNGWIERKDVNTFNHYRPPRLVLGDAAQAGRWLDHVRKIYPDDAAHIILWLAFKVQRPFDKINHAIVLGGEQGIGKDTLLEPVKYAVGPWNFNEVSPVQMLGRFNDYLKSVILRVSEAHDLGGMNRFTLYERTKTYNAVPPDTLRIDEKYLNEYYVFNCLGLIITTNYKTDGIYLPLGDRRHYVAWSRSNMDDFTPEYWNELWGWYQTGGIRHVAAYLTELDLSDFDPKAPPPKTAAFWDIVMANSAPEDAELADLLDGMGKPAKPGGEPVAPDAVTLAQVVAAATTAESDIAEWLLDRRNRRAIPHRMERCGYAAVRNPEVKDGLWRVNNKRQVIYAKDDLELREQMAVAERLQQRREK